MRKEGRGKGEEEKKDLEESRAAVPFGFHVVLPDMRGRVRGKESTSINSCYITSLVDAKWLNGRREKKAL